MLTKNSLLEAAERVNPLVHKTPILQSEMLNELAACKLYFKCENFQKTGSFKARGATNSVLQLSETEAAKGVATHSSGNHGQALAWAANQRGIPSYIVMPENAPQVKIKAVKGYGAEVIFCTSNLASRESTLEEVMQKTGATFIPPYNFENTIAGQASCAKEIFEELQPDFLLVPVGGGGLLSGSALSAYYFSPQTKVVGCEPALADDAKRSFEAGDLIPLKHTETIADGLRTSLGDITFYYIQNYVDQILTCAEKDIISAMKLVWERMKMIIEPSSAVPLACLLNNRGLFRDKEVALIISGGNVDLGKLPF